jgi:hypothetical protein
MIPDPLPLLGGREREFGNPPVVALVAPPPHDVMPRPATSAAARARRATRIYRNS